MLRKIITTLILVPLAIILIAFVLANRQEVTVSLDPFDPAHPAYSTTMWLFVPIIASLIIGVIVGGVAAWLGHGRWRRTARRLEREVGALRSELVAQRRAAGAPVNVPQAVDPPERLRLKPPVR